MDAATRSKQFAREARALEGAFRYAPSPERIAHSMAFWTGTVQNAPKADELHAIRVDCTSLCCGTATNSPLPYESPYVGEERMLKGPGCVELARTYAKHGFIPFEGDSNEPEDFLPTLLGFLAFLYDEAYRAFAAGDENRAESLQSEADAFKTKHLDPWLPRYCDEAEPLVNTPYYESALKRLRSFAMF